MTFHNPYDLKLAQTDQERRAVQELRYDVFIREMGADQKTHGQNGLEFDALDEFCDYLILCDRSLDPSQNQVVGAYRLLRNDQIPSTGKFYSESEFDLTKVISTQEKFVELGRTCVRAGYRDGMALFMLLQGVADYVKSYGARFMFGTASFAGTDVQAVSPALAYLGKNYKAPDGICVPAIGANRIEIDTGCAFDKKEALAKIPPLIKTYLRMGGRIGDGAYLDKNFNTIDVLIILDQFNISDKSRRFLEHSIKL